MARPKKDDAEKLTESLPAIRVTAEEKAFVIRMVECRSISISHYIRDLIHADQNSPADRIDCTKRAAQNDHSNTPNTDTSLDNEVIYQLRAIGTNLNQLTKLGHLNGFIPPEVIGVSHTLKEILNHVFKNLNL